MGIGMVSRIAMCPLHATTSVAVSQNCTCRGVYFLSRTTPRVRPHPPGRRARPSRYAGVGYGLRNKLRQYAAKKGVLYPPWACMDWFRRFHLQAPRVFSVVQGIAFGGDGLIPLSGR